MGETDKMPPSGDLPTLRHSVPAVPAVPVRTFFSLCTLTFSFLGSLSGDEVICLASIREWDLAVLALHQDKVRTGIVFPVVCLEGWPDVHVLLLFPMYYTELSTVIIPSLSTVAPPMMAGAGHGSRECIFPPWYIMDLELTLVLHGVW